MSNYRVDTNTLMSQVRSLLDAKNPRSALDLLQHVRDLTPEMKNARAVCLLRLGEAEKAAHVLRDLLVPQGSVTLIPAFPTVYKTNFAVALLLTRNVSGCISLLHEINDENDPGVIKIRAAIERWKKSLGILRRILFALYGDIGGPPVVLDFAPGDLPEPPPAKRAA